MAGGSDNTRLVLKDAVAVLRGLARELDAHERTLRAGDAAVESRHEAVAEARREVADVAHRVNAHLRRLGADEPSDGGYRYDRRAHERRAKPEATRGGRRRAPRRNRGERRDTQAVN
jgi:hypothetical protein